MKQKDKSEVPHVVSDFLLGGGEMGRLIRAYGCTKTSLRKPVTWSQSLRTAVRLMLNTNHPVFIFWGDDINCFYNNAGVFNDKNIKTRTELFSKLYTRALRGHPL